MGSSASRATFIEKQRATLVQELVQAQQGQQAAQGAVNTAYQAALQAAEAMRAPFDTALAQARRDARQRGRKGALVEALTLRALSRHNIVVIVAWGVLLWSFFARHRLAYMFSELPFPLWLMAWPLSLVPLCFLLYPALVWWGRRRLGNLRASAELQLIEQLAQCTLQPHGLGQKHADGRSHPYPAARVPCTDPTDPTINWNLFEKHDNSRAVLVGLSRDLGKEPEAFIRLPFNGHPAGYIPIVTNEDGLHARWAAACEAAAPAMAAFAGPIATLRTACDPWEREGLVLTSLRKQLSSLDKLEANWQDVAIPEDLLEQIIKLVDRFSAGTPPLPKGLLMWGPPGTGKTLIARKLAEHVNCNFVAVTIADLKAEFIGQTGPKVKKLWEEARSKGPTILFVDECESAFARRGSGDTDAFGNELVQTFIAEWDGFHQGGGNVLVIGATNRRELLDDAVMSRFTTAIELPAPDAPSRERILAAEFAKARIELPVTEAMVRDTSGMSGRDLSTLVTNVVSTHATGRPSLEDFSAAIARMRGKSSTTVQHLTWDDVILPTSTRSEFESLGKELLHAEELAKLNIPVPRGILLYGPPGTGKTQIARVLAGQSGLSFISASSSDVKAANIGASGIKVKQLFEKARTQAPCILFLDEIDTVAGSRNTGDTMSNEIVAQLLQELDGVSTQKGQIFLLAASNHPDSIDSALLSRMERKILIGLPDASARAGILRLQLAGKPMNFEVDDLLDEVAEATEGFSGRDLQSLVTASTRRALQRAMLEHADPTKVKLERNDLLAELGTIVA